MTLSALRVEATKNAFFIQAISFHNFKKRKSCIAYWLTMKSCQSGKNRADFPTTRHYGQPSEHSCIMVVYLIGPTRRSTLWILAWRHRNSSLQNTANMPEPSAKGKMAAVREKAGQRNTPGYHGRPYCYGRQNWMHWNHHPIRLLTVPIDDAWPGYVVLSFFRRERESNWINSWIISKDTQFFRRGIHIVPERLKYCC